MLLLKPYLLLITVKVNLLYTKNLVTLFQVFLDFSLFYVHHTIFVLKKNTRNSVNPVFPPCSFWAGARFQTFREFSCSFAQQMAGLQE